MRSAAAAFALAVVITVLFNTFLACFKDAGYAGKIDPQRLVSLVAAAVAAAAAGLFAWYALGVRR